MGWPGLKVHGCCCTGVCLDGETREEEGLGWHSPPTETLPVGLGRRMLRLCTPLPRPCACAMIATNWGALGSMSAVAQTGHRDQVIAFKGRGVWMCFVAWDLAAVAGPYFGTCTLCISACPGTSWLTDPREQHSTFLLFWPMNCTDPSITWD